MRHFLFGWLLVALLVAGAGTGARAEVPGDADRDALLALIDGHTARLELEPARAELHLDLCEAHFLLNDFERAVRACTTALDIDATYDRALLLRGMARGRALDIGGGIDDITRYLADHPDDSHAYTKRGVRHLWLKDFDSARADLERAIEIDPANAEARDDLGVVYAMQDNYTLATLQFIAAIMNDPTYQKAYHNLAMAYFMTGKDAQALEFVDKALAMSPESLSANSLKVQVLTALGRTAEAEALRDDLKFLPDENWSETVPLK